MNTKKIIKFAAISISIITLSYLIYRCVRTYSNPYEGNQPNSIVFFDKIKLGGVDQQILIRGKNQNNPAILFLHGGPGTPDMSFVRYYNTSLEDHFVVVTWDQRGAGKSFDEKVFDGSFSTDRLLSDTKELVEYIKEKLHKDKVYIVGHSWGSLLGMKFVKAYPELVEGFLSVSQVVNLSESENYSFDFLTSRIKSMNQPELSEKLKAISPPVKGKYPGGVAAMMQERELLLKAGGVLKKYVDYDPMIESMQATTETNYPDFIRLNDAFSKSVKSLWGELLQIDLRKSITEIKVPTIFIYGKEDKVISTPLIEEYINILNAPSKKTYLFENSAHFPQIEENEKFNQIIISHWSSKK